MNKTLLWAEWRQKRFIFIATAIIFGGIWLLTWIAACVFPAYQIKDAYDNVIGILILLSFYVIPILGLYDPSMGMNPQKNANSFLFAMPVSPGKIFWTKFITGQAFLLLFYSVNLALIYLWDQVWGMDPSIKLKDIAFMALLLVPVYWVFFGISLTTRTKTKPYTVFILSLYYAVVTGFIVFYVLIDGLLDSVFRHIAVSFCLSFIIVCLYGLFRIRHIWEIGVVRNMPITKVSLKESLRLFLISTALFVLTWGYTWINYKSAQTQAIKLGIITSIYNKVVPENQNGANFLIQFSKRWEPVWKQIEQNKDYCKLFDKWKAPLTDHQKEIIAQMKSQQLLDADRYLDQAMNAPHIRITPTAQNDWNSGWDELLNAAHYLELKATSAEYKNNTKELFFTIDDMIKLAQIVPDAIPDISSGIFYSRACWFAFLLGPDTKDAIDYYQKLLDETEHVNLFSTDDQWNTLDAMISTKFPWKLFPIYLGNQATMLRQYIAEKKLIMQATNGLPSIYKKAKKMVVPTSTHDYFQSSPIYRYFRYQSRLNLNRIALALKIYRIEHGNFPDSLDKLSPGIFKKVPVDTFNGKPFQYRRTKNGFILSGGKDIKIIYPKKAEDSEENNDAK